MGLRYGSVCSGIEAASVAWKPLGWEAQFFAEIEAFPKAVLAHHYPNVPNHGDMTKFQDWPDHAIDLLVGGTPCQSFSVAGLRAGLADPRGNLALTYLAIAAKYRPRWLVWENVPGVLSADGGEAFGSILGGMVELGYGIAYRVLDAQFCRASGLPYAVPQRRRRVFVVGYLGDWRRAAAVLFDGASLRGDPAPRREAGKGVAPTISARPTGGGGLGTDFDLDGGLTAIKQPQVSVTLTARDRKGPLPEADLSTVIVSHALRAEGHDASEDGTGRGTPIIAFNARQDPDVSGDVTLCLNAGGMGRQDYETETMVVSPVAGTMMSHKESGGWSNSIDHAAGGYMVAHALRADGFDASEDGTGRGTPLIAFDTTQITSKANYSNPKPGDPSHPLASGAHPPAVAFDMRGREGGAQFEGPHETANIRAASGGSSRSYVADWAVRRLTPTECERLQGFPDGYTQVPSRGKPAADGPRYKALGNSFAVNVVRVLGERIQMIDAI